MELKFLKWHLVRSPLIRRVVLRAFMLVLALILVSVLQMSQMSGEIQVIQPIGSKAADSDKCPLNLGPELNLTRLLKPGSSPSTPNESENLTRVVFKELMEKNLLQSNARALCVGPNSASALLALRHMGFFNAQGAEKHPSFSLIKRRFVYELSFKDNHFDFVYSENIDRLSVPSLLVREIERVVRPGGTGAILGRKRGFYLGEPVSSFLKSSDVVYECAIGPVTLVIFKKKLVGFASFQGFQLPDNCPSIDNNQPYMKHIEPIKREKIGISYLPNFMNISARNRLVYINIGAGEYARESISNLSGAYCGDHHAAFEVFIIDHKTSVLSSYVTEPGISFVYDPSLTGEIGVPEITPDEFLSAPLDEEGFEFGSWFKETISDGDVVVLMMEVKVMEMKILVELFETGGICHVDELFLHCPSGDCLELLKSLRGSGVYVHQWLGG